MNGTLVVLGIILVLDLLFVWRAEKGLRAYRRASDKIPPQV